MTSRTATTKQARKRANVNDASKPAAKCVPIQKEKRTKLQRLVHALSRSNGATIADLRKVTGWQAHSVRGALAGALRKKGHAIESTKVNGVRRYRIIGVTT